MRVWRGAFFVFFALCACSSGGSVNPPVTHPVQTPPGGNGGGSASPSPTPTPTPAPQVAITETSVAVEPLYVAQGIDGSAYFGFGANGSGSNLYRYDGHTFVQTQPAPPPNGLQPGGGVYGIDVAQNGSVYWLSSYYGGQQYLPYVLVECGGSGGTATQCEPNIDEPTSMLVDSNGVFWVAGISSTGGGQMATNSGASYDSPDEGVLQIVNGPNNSVWGLLQSSSQTYSIAQFAISGNAIAVVQQYALPTGSAAGSMTLAGDGNLWFTDYATARIGRMTPAGAVNEYSSPHPIDGPQYGEVQATTDCDGNVWYTESSYGAIVRVDSAGNTHEYVVPTMSGYPGAIAATPRGAPCRRTMWVGEARASKLALITY